MAPVRARAFCGLRLAATASPASSLQRLPDHCVDRGRRYRRYVRGIGRRYCQCTGGTVCAVHFDGLIRWTLADRRERRRTWIRSAHACEWSAGREFFADAVSAAMTDATAVAAGNEGSVVVAGAGVSGTTIMRLHADGGAFDALFGRAGSTQIDIRSTYGSASAVHAMFVGADGGVFAAGGDRQSNTAFVARLLGAGGGKSPGVGITVSLIPTAEGAGEVVVNVRRTGGADGSVSVTYEKSAEGHGRHGFRSQLGSSSWGLRGHDQSRIQRTDRKRRPYGTGGELSRDSPR